jgi:sugar/nucleoside kinase (ribokinase family)
MDLFFPNETEAMAISGKDSVHEALEELTRDSESLLVVVTTGPQGATAKRGQQMWTHAAYDVSSTALVLSTHACMHTSLTGVITPNA